MAQAAFFVNDLRIIDKGRVLILEAQRQCGHGQIMEHVYLTIPAELKRVFADFVGRPARDDKPSSDKTNSVWRNRLDQYFEKEN